MRGVSDIAHNRSKGVSLRAVTQATPAIDETVSTIIDVQTVCTPSLVIGLCQFCMAAWLGSVSHAGVAVLQRT